MDLFKRLPKFRPLPAQKDPIVFNQELYPTLAADFKIVDRVVLPDYQELDREAIRLQNAHWWTYFILIAGGAVATICGILQLALRIDGFGIAGAIVAAVLGSSTLALNAFHYQERYMHNRLAAEALRSEYFRFLGQIENYNRANRDRVTALEDRVRSIKEVVEA